jgi:hypothetical protein
VVRLLGDSLPFVVDGVATPGDIEALKWLGVSTRNRLNYRKSSCLPQECNVCQLPLPACKNRGTRGGFPAPSLISIFVVR